MRWGRRESGRSPSEGSLAAPDAVVVPAPPPAIEREPS